MRGVFETVTHAVDFCVVGGGLAGLCAAVSAARHGARVALMQDRPMLGGNASSEIRMWISGAHGRDMRETGLIEEIALDNQYRNPDKNYSVWDSILYEKARMEPNLLLLLNCTCLDADAQDGRITAVLGWQMTTQRYHKVYAGLFADCSGDSVLAPLTGAAFRMGRESREEFGESIAPEKADRKTMGMSCLLQARQEAVESEFIAPDWAEKIDDSKLAHRMPDLSQVTENFWYLELGGDRDAIGDTETLRDELLALAYGMWDYLKNAPSQREKNRNWKLDWVGILPGKRESRRYVGGVTMTQGDVLSADGFSDVVAYGGWTMDDHHPAGFRAKEPPNIFHPAPSPFAIPYRALYSVNVENLFFAGRNISVTHAAMSATRVMATCALLGQAVGTAAALAAQAGCLPCAVDVRQLQQRLLDDDCYLPGIPRIIPPLTARASLAADGTDAEALRDGTDRPVDGTQHAWQARPGHTACYTFDAPTELRRVRIVFDSDLNRETLPPLESVLKRNMFHNRLLGQEASHPSQTLIRAYRVVACLPDGTQEVLAEEHNNHQRLRRHAVQVTANAVRLELISSWGCEQTRVFGFEVE